MSENQEEALKIAQDILSDKENRPDVDTLMLSQEVVAQAQIIARLMAELVDKNSTIHQFALENNALRNLADRALTEMATARADALERAAEYAETCPPKFNDEPNRFTVARGIRALITPTDAAARDERDRRIREKIQTWANNCAVYEAQHKAEGSTLSEEYHRGGKEAFQRVSDLLRAPVPAERAGNGGNDGSD